MWLQVQRLGVLSHSVHATILENTFIARVARALHAYSALPNGWNVTLSGSNNSFQNAARRTPRRIARQRQRLEGGVWVAARPHSNLAAVVSAPNKSPLTDSLTNSPHSSFVDVLSLSKKVFPSPQLPPCARRRLPVEERRGAASDCAHVPGARGAEGRAPRRREG